MKKQVEGEEPDEEDKKDRVVGFKGNVYLGGMWER